ncbi:MAG: hypothetical protein U0798_18520 [Gemmataceae bacterium]
MWLRVFGRSEQHISTVQIVEQLHQAGFPVVPAFKGDDLGWTEGSLTLESGSPILLSRYLTDVDDLRDDLNAYAAELEGYNFQPAAQALMERVIQTRQLITIRKPVDHSNEVLLNDVCDRLCKNLAGMIDGVYQIDGQGWYSAEGNQIIQEY